VEVKRHILFGSEDDLIQILETDGGGSQINTSYRERDNLTVTACNGNGSGLQSTKIWDQIKCDYPEPPSSACLDARGSTCISQERLGGAPVSYISRLGAESVS
jgi:ethanolamine utilization protein EutA (predicted chaperonin)